MLRCLRKAAASNDADRTAEQEKFSPMTYSVLDPIQENT